MKLYQDDLVPVLTGLSAILLLLAKTGQSDLALRELLERAIELLNEAIESQI